MTVTTELPDADRDAGQEIRLAVVLNGGVSLAVWMGGVTHEIDRLTRRAGAYGVLLDLFDARARVDVISGTSAGGINGAALAISQVQPQGGLGRLREVWEEQGRMESLLRPAFSGDPASLLRGDDYFLPRMREALGDLATTASTVYSAKIRPIDLTITTSLLRGARSVHTDSLGTQTTQRRHDGRFRFQRGLDGDERDDFTPDVLRETTVPRLALAARATASYPVAFEPAFIPAGDKTVDGLPDMRPVISWGQDGDAGDAEDRSRYVVDGGVLMNTPTRPALEAVERMSSAVPVRRLMLLVVPLPETPKLQDDPADARDKPPTLAGMLGGLLTAMRADSGRSSVDLVEEHNRRAASRRAVRGSLAEHVVATPDAGTTLARLAEAVGPVYVRRQARCRAEAEAAAVDVRLPAPARRHAHEPQVGASRASLAEHRERELFIGARLPDVDWVQTEPVLFSNAASEFWARPVVEGALATVLQFVADAAAGVARDGRQQGRSRRSDKRADLLAVEREQVHAVREALTRLRDDLPATDTGGGSLWSLLLKLGEAAVSTAEALGQPKDLADRRNPYVQLFAGQPVEAAAQRLLQLEVAAGCRCSDGETPKTDQTISLVQVTLATQNAFASFSREPDDKLGGMALNRFSGFLKRSWRVNDWAWGRMDGATRLCQVLLQPQQVKDLASADPKGWLAKLVGKVYGEETPLPAQVSALVAAASAELHELVKRDDVPRSLPRLADMVAWSLHADAVEEELPALARAIRADLKEQASSMSRGAVFLAKHGAFADELAYPDPDRAARLQRAERALRAFDTTGIGREPLADEAPSDQMVRTAATAIGVAVTVLDGKQSGLAPLKPVTRVLRGAALVPYWAVIGLTRGGTLVRFLALLALSLGAVAVGVDLASDSTPAWVTLVGIGVVVGTFGYAALRTGSLVHGAALFGVGVPLVAIGASGSDREVPGVVVVVGALAVVLLVLGSLRPPLRSPVAVWVDAGAALGRARADITRWARQLAVVAAAVTGVTLVLRMSGTDADAVDLARLPVRAAAVLGGLALLAGVVLPLAAKRGIVSLRRGDERRVSHPAGVAAGWAVVYGVLYLAAAAVASLVVARRDSGRWADSPDAIAICVAVGAVLGVVLAFVTPGFVVRRAQRRLEDRLLARALGLRTLSGRGDADLRLLLELDGERYRFLIEDGQLTKRGRALALKIDAKRPTPLAAPVKRVVRAGDVVLTDVAPEVAGEPAVMIDLRDGRQFSVRRCTEVRVSGLLHQAAVGEELVVAHFQPQPPGPYQVVLHVAAQARVVDLAGNNVLVTAVPVGAEVRIADFAQSVAVP